METLQTVPLCSTHHHTRFYNICISVNWLKSTIYVVSDSTESTYSVVSRISTYFVEPGKDGVLLHI